MISQILLGLGLVSAALGVEDFQHVLHPVHVIKKLEGKLNIGVWNGSTCEFNHLYTLSSGVDSESLAKDAQEEWVKNSLRLASEFGEEHIDDHGDAVCETLSYHECQHAVGCVSVGMRCENYQELFVISELAREYHCEGTPFEEFAFCAQYQLENDACAVGCSIPEASDPVQYIGSIPYHEHAHCMPGKTPHEADEWIDKHLHDGTEETVFGTCAGGKALAGIIDHNDLTQFHDLTEVDTTGDAGLAAYVAKYVAAETATTAAACAAVGTFELNWDELRLEHVHAEDYLHNHNYASTVIALPTGDLESEDGEVGGLDTVWLLLTSAMIFTAQLAHVAVVNGRQGTYGNFAIKVILNFCVAIVAWYLTGYAFTYGRSNDDKLRNAFIGNFNFALHYYDEPHHTGPFYGLPFFVHGFAYALYANLITSTGIGGRGTVLAHILSTWYIVGFAYPVVAHWVLSDNGWLSFLRVGDKKEDKVVGAVGTIDFAASGPVHLFAASAAFAASLFSRKAEVPKTEDTHQMSLGAFMTIFAGYAYIVSSAINPDFESMVSGEHHYAMAAGRAAINFSMSIAGSVFLTLFLEAIVAKEFNLTHTVNAINAGFAAICSNCLTCEPWAAFLAGLVAGLLYFAGRRGLAFLKDNDVFATHGLSGAWGLLFTGLLARPSLIRHLIIDSWYGGVGAKPTGVDAVLGKDTFEDADKPYNPFYSPYHAGVFYPAENVHGKLLGMMILEATVIFAWGFCVTLPLYAILWAVGQMTIKNAEGSKADA